ncbi:MAG: phosphate signaling complex protein PhoU [Spirochaetales bacterium]|uniref:Phosphate-specific transport system accessory protein PhoU n=1 Tax=Candidatus Thalassospirochaeta sargassi TaxID=3119039 RepID=A0AAJ1MHY1_9SPIO|nr:phosphate signaling complex protein PhoU [Spirochaetales bacterium]
MQTKSRIHFSNMMKELNEQILKMGIYVEEAMKKAVAALRDQNIELAEEVIKEDDRINEFELELFDKVSILLATEQPVATDLRHLTGAIRIISDLERAGDYAVHIAKGAKRLAGETYITPLQQIPEAADMARQMLKDALTAFVNSDEELAREVASRDDVLDKLHKKLIKKMLKYMNKDSEAEIEQAANLMFLARYLERLGDHITNVCEWVIYSKTGKHPEL